MAEQHSTRTISDVIAAQVGELFDGLTLLAAATALNREIEQDQSGADANAVTSPHERLDSLLRMAQDKLQVAIGAFNAVN